MSELDTMPRAVCEQQLAIAAATERLQVRQIRLLETQRVLIEEQLAEAIAKRDQAIRDQKTARELLI